jgi:hypothetical protein
MLDEGTDSKPALLHFCQQLGAELSVNPNGSRLVLRQNGAGSPVVTLGATVGTPPFALIRGSLLLGHLGAIEV